MGVLECIDSGFKLFVFGGKPRRQRKEGKGEGYHQSCLTVKVMNEKPHSVIPSGPTLPNLSLQA